MTQGARSENPLQAASRRPALRIAPLCLGYTLLAAIVTFPLVLHLGEGLPGPKGGDQGQYLWCVDTFWTQLLAGQSPLWTGRVLYPVGANLMHVTAAPLVSLLAFPVHANPLLYFGLAVPASMVLAAFGARALVRTLTENDVAAAVAGCLYAFGPTTVYLADVVAHYYTLAAAALLPWGLDALVRFLRAPRLGSLLGLSAVTWALVFTDYYVTVLFLVMVAVTGGACVRRRHLRPVLAAAFANGFLAFAAQRWVLPPLDTGDLFGGAASLWSRGVANLADFVVPASGNPLLGWTAAYARDRPNSYFLGWGILALALYATAWRRGPTVVRPLAAAGIASALLAGGTSVRAGDAVLLTDAWTPWYWLVQIPHLDLLDVPRRFVLGPQCVVAVLAGVGLARLAKRGLAPGAVALLGLGLFAVEYGQVGMQLYVPRVPAVHRRLAAMPERTLLELPSGVTESKRVFGYDFTWPNNNEQMYFQTVHRKRRVGAYLSRIPHATYRWFEAEPVIGDIFTLTSQADAGGAGVYHGRRLARLPDYPRETVERFIRRFDLGYVLIQPGPRQEIFVDGIDRLLAGRIASKETDDEGYVLYVVDRTRSLKRQG